MSTKRIIGIIAGGILAIILIYSFSGGETNEQYIERINKEREDKERFMRSSKTSPFRESNIKFNGLQYYKPDPHYKLVAKFTPAERPDALLLPTSDGKEMRYLPYGYADFELDNTNNRLLILKLADGSEEDGHLFIPFGDETSADETYGAGRYLDINHQKNKKTVELDFNKAYNPYCAYSETYSCPLPPRENLLPIPIRAGEKTYK